MCHVGKNKNKDIFEKEDLESNASTIVNKPINWEHTSRNIGVVYESKYVDVAKLDEASKAAFASLDTLEKDFVVCKGAIWEYKHPDEARTIRQRHAAKELKFSMENKFQIAKCTTCNNEFDSPSHYCDHLLTRRDPGSTTGRIFKGSNFVGAAVVKFPADKDANSLAIASTSPDFYLIDSISINDYKNFVLIPKENLMKKKNIPEKYIIEDDNIPDEGFADDINRVFPIDNKEHIVSTAKILYEDKLDFYNKEETIYVLNKLSIAAHNEGIDLREYVVMNDKGGSHMDEKEFEKAVAVEVEKRIKEFESKNATADLNSKIKNLEDQVSKATQEIKDKEDARAKIEKEFSDFKDGIAKDKLIVDRIEELKTKGLVFAENLEVVKNSIRDMDKEAFDAFAKILNEARGKELTPEEKKKLEEEKKLEEKKKKDAKGSDIVNESKGSFVPNKPEDTKGEDPFAIIDKILGRK